jgi:Flp pilus assembly pilin Flp
MNIRALVRLVRDDSGQDLVEYALLAGMVGTGALLFFVLFTTVMGFEYFISLGRVYDAWAPCPPAPGVCP